MHVYIKVAEAVKEKHREAKSSTKKSKTYEYNPVSFLEKRSKSQF